MLRLCLQRTLPEGGLHQDLRPQLEARRQHRGRRVKLHQDLNDLHRRVHEHRPRPEGPSRGAGGQGEQRLHQTQAGDGDPQRREAPQGRKDPAEQEDRALLRPGAGRHHGGHQTGLWSREEALHAGWETGEAMVYTKHNSMFLFVVSQVETV